MPRKTRSALLDNRTNRLKLAPRPKPFFHTISPGVALGYRRNATGAGTWSVRAADGSGANWLRRLALADDQESSDGKSILDFFQAIDAARKLARAGDDDQPGDRPATVDEALTAYAADLIARNGMAGNVGRVRRHLPAALAGRPVASLTAKELRAWRNGLVKSGLAPASADRTARALSAALSLAAKDDKRIRRGAWRDGLARLPDVEQARVGAILPDETVKALVSEAYKLDHSYGLLIELSAITGARRSQLLRIQVRDLQDAGAAPRVMVPTSRKGRRRTTERRPLPISTGLARALRLAAAGRPDSDPLLAHADGSRWAVGDAFFEKIVAKVAGLDASTTGYCLRHSSVVRQILAGVSLRVVAASHDTSTDQIEKNYSRFIIGDASDVACRRAMLDLTATSAAPKVVKLGQVA
jgi:integrase